MADDVSSPDEDFWAGYQAEQPAEVARTSRGAREWLAESAQSARTWVHGIPSWSAMFGPGSPGSAAPTAQPRSRRELREQRRQQRGPVVAASAVLAAAAAGSMAALLGHPETATTLGTPSTGAFPAVPGPTRSPRVDGGPTVATPKEPVDPSAVANQTVTITPRVRHATSSHQPAVSPPPGGQTTASAPVAVPTPVVSNPASDALPPAATVQNSAAAVGGEVALDQPSVPSAIAARPEGAARVPAPRVTSESPPTHSDGVAVVPGAVVPASIAGVPGRPANTAAAWPALTYTLRAADGAQEPRPFPDVVTGYRLIDRSRTTVRLEAGRYFRAVGDLPVRTATYEVCRDQRFFVRWMAVDPKAYVDATLVDEPVRTVQNVPVHGAAGWMSSYGCVQPALRISPSEGVHPASADIIVETEVWQR